LQVQCLNPPTINFPNYFLVNIFTEKAGKFRLQKSPIAGSWRILHQSK